MVQLINKNNLWLRATIPLVLVVLSKKLNIKTIYYYRKQPTDLSL